MMEGWIDHNPNISQAYMEWIQRHESAVRALATEARQVRCQNGSRAVGEHVPRLLQHARTGENRTWIRTGTTTERRMTVWTVK